MLLASLFLCMGTAWAYQFSYDKTTWTVPATNHEKVTTVPEEVFTVYNTNYSDQTELSADKVGVYAEEVNVTGSTVTVTLAYTSDNGSNIRLDICGVDLVATDGSVVYQDYHFGWAGGSPSNNTYTLNEVVKGSYTLRVFVASQKEDFTNASNNSRGNMTVTGASHPIVGSTAENKIFYHIKNVKSGKYANYEGAGVQFTQVSIPTLGSYWYLMEVADAQNVLEGYKAYRLYNAANVLAVENPSNGYMSANEGVQWPAKVYCIGEHTKGGYTGVVLRPLGEDNSSWNDANGYGTKIGTYSYDDGGSIWEFEKANITEAQLIQNAVAAKTAVVNTLTTEATNTQRYYYGYELSAIEAKQAEIEAISVPENSLAEAMTGAIKISKNTLLAGFERIAPKAGDKFTMVNRGRNSGKDGLVAFAAGTDVKCLQSPFPYFDAVWTLVATGTEGQFKLYNEKLKVYVGVLSDNNNTKFQYVTGEEEAGVYELANVEGYATFKKVGGDNNSHLHQSNWGGKEIVRWDNGDCSQWQLAKAFGPELTTDVNNPICYALKSGRDGNYYFTLDNNKVKLFNNKSIATEETTHWYFMLDGSGNLKMYSKSDNKAMGYLTSANNDGNTRLTNDNTVNGYESDTYTLYFAPYNQTNYNDAWFALKPSSGNTYVSNHGGTGNYMGFYNSFNDGGTRIAFESVDRMRLEAKVAECEPKVVGDGLGRYSVSGGDAATVLADAKAALQGNSNVAYRNSLAALNTLTYTLNMPETGKFYRLQNHQSGWYATSDIREGEDQHSNKLWMANENNTARTIWYLTDDNKFLSYTMGQYLGDMSSDWSFETIGAEGNVVVFNESDVAGKYQILPSSGRALYGDQVRVDAAGETNKSGNYAWSIQEVTWLPVAMNATVGYATFYSPVELELSYGRVKAYTGKVDGKVFKLTEQDVVPANTGVILELQEGAVVENGYTFLQVKETTPADLDNDLAGTFAKTYVTDDAYVLANKDGIGLYKATKNQQEGTAFLNNAFKAYLPATAVPSGAQALRFTRGGDDETTSIDQLINTDSELVIYDLAGRRVEKMEKGIYIVNGKKVIR